MNKLFAIEPEGDGDWSKATITKYLMTIFYLALLSAAFIALPWRMRQTSAMHFQNNPKMVLPLQNTSRGQTMLKQWSFSDAPNTAVITTAQVAHNNKAILSVIHQAGWQFLDGEDVAASDAIVVGLLELTQKDASLELVADLPEGWQAWRKTRSSPWQRSPL